MIASVERLRDTIGAVLGVRPDGLPDAFVQAVLRALEITTPVQVAAGWALHEELELLGYPTDSARIVGAMTGASRTVH